MQEQEEKKKRVLKLGLSSNLLQTTRLKSVHIVGQIMWQNMLKVKVCYHYRNSTSFKNLIYVQAL